MLQQPLHLSKRKWFWGRLQMPQDALHAQEQHATATTASYSARWRLQKGDRLLDSPPATAAASAAVIPIIITSSAAVATAAVAAATPKVRWAAAAVALSVAAARPRRRPAARIVLGHVAPHRSAIQQLCKGRHKHSQLTCCDTGSSRVGRLAVGWCLIARICCSSAPCHCSLRWHPWHLAGPQI